MRLSPMTDSLVTGRIMGARHGTMTVFDGRVADAAHEFYDGIVRNAFSRFRLDPMTASDATNKPKRSERDAFIGNR